jgi:hypothetical protein
MLTLVSLSQLPPQRCDPGVEQTHDVPIAQQGCPMAPHETQVFDPPHVVPAVQAVPLAQQGCPTAAPHEMHMPVPTLQFATPPVHALPAQQG